MVQNMKKRNTLFAILTLITVMALSIVIMTGCSEDQAGNTIKKWQPQDKEVEEVLGILTEGEYYGIGSYTAEKEMKSVGFGYEYYKGSKLVKDHESGSVSLSGKNEGKVGVSADAANYRMFSIENGEGAGLVRGSLQGWDDKNKGIGFSSLDEESFEPGKKCYIAALVEGDNLADPEAMLADKELMNKNKKSWLFYVIFSDKEQKK